MKLDFEPNTTSTYSTEITTTADANFSVDSNRFSKMLQAGVKAAQEGNRSEAGILLRQVAEAEPENENAWLWLASISEYPEELLGFLNNVLRINPDNERALEWARATKSLLAKTFLQRGIEAARENQNAFARQCFLQAIARENENETAWLWLASVSETVEEKQAYLEKVLLLNPENDTALSSLEMVKKQVVETYLPQACAAAFAGDAEAALETLEKILAQSPHSEDALFLKSHLILSFDEKISCFEKILEANPDSTSAAANAAFLRSMRSKSAAKKRDLPEAEESESGERFAEASEFENAEFAPEAANGSFDSDGESEAERKLAAENDDEFFVQQNPAEAQVKETTETEAVSKIDSNPTPELDEVVSASEAEDDFAPEAVSYSEERGEESQRQNIDFDAGAQPETIQTTEDVYENVYVSDGTDETETNNDEAETKLTAVVTQQEDEIAEAENQDEEMFVVSEFENASEDAEIADEIAGIYAEYAEAEEMENADDAATAENGEEVFPIEEAGGGGLPSYYEAEAEVFSTPPLIENDFAPDMEEEADELNLFLGNDTAEANEFSEPENQVSEQENQAGEMAAQAAEDSEFEDFGGEVFAEQSAAEEVFVCPFCKSDNEPQAFVCQSCRAMLSLSDLEMLLAYKDGDGDAVRRAVREMEAEKKERDFDADELKFLGVGQMNLKNFRQGFKLLQEAARLNPNDVVLGSQINALAIRLAEIEQQESVHNSMPKNKTILVVDDSATVRKLISGKLEKCGHTVFSAVDGMDALDKINQIVPDLILLDINMPRMDGYQVCKMIRGNAVTKDVPVVMISGKDGFFDKVRGRMAGTTGYITKPFGPETLMRTVENYIVADGGDGNIENGGGLNE